jgi:hypothetical protein
MCSLLIIEATMTGNADAEPERDPALARPVLFVIHGVLPARKCKELLNVCVQTELMLPPPTVSRNRFPQPAYSLT